MKMTVSAAPPRSTPRTVWLEPAPVPCRPQLGNHSLGTTAWEPPLSNVLTMPASFTTTVAKAFHCSDTRTFDYLYVYRDEARTDESKCKHCSARETSWIRASSIVVLGCPGQLLQRDVLNSFFFYQCILFGTSPMQ